MAVRQFIGAVGVAVFLFASTVVAAAAPSFNSGSFAFSAATSTVSDLQTTNGLFILNPTSLATSSPAGDFASSPPPATLALPNVNPILDITFASDFDFSDAVFGAFTATSISSLHTTINGALVTVDFNVLGTFLPGTGWLNAGSNFTASQSWLLSQTGGQGKTISMNGTFQSPGNVAPAPGPVPEPATLALLAFGLLAAGTLHARKARQASA